jgi:hypothetical protein
MLFKKLIKSSEIKEGDNFIAYYHSKPSSTTIRPLYFHVDEIRGGTTLFCTRIKKDGTLFRDRWYETQEVRFTRYKERDELLTTRSFCDWSHYDGGTFYLNSDVPCALIINNLIEEKRKINKAIIDCQHLMYSIEHDS